MWFSGALPVRSQALPAPCHAVPIPPRTRWARAAPREPPSWRLGPARRCSGSSPAPLGAIPGEGWLGG
eukprot:6310295-Prymnesium_polylepis.1